MAEKYTPCIPLILSVNDACLMRVMASEAYKHTRDVHPQTAAQYERVFNALNQAVAQFTNVSRDG